MGKKQYIATQNPTPDTCAHFWHMVYANSGNKLNNSHCIRPVVILMLSPLLERGRRVCAPYWPAVPGDTFEYAAGDEFARTLAVTCIDTEPISAEQPFISATTTPLVVKTTLSVACPEDGRAMVVYHIQVPAWAVDTHAIADEPDITAIIRLCDALAREPVVMPVIPKQSGFHRKFDFVSRRRSDGSQPLGSIAKKSESLGRHQKSSSLPVNTLSVAADITPLTPAKKHMTANGTGDDTNNTVAPLIVHCNAGVSHTGTYIALDYLFTQTKLLAQLLPPPPSLSSSSSSGNNHNAATGDFSPASQLVFSNYDPIYALVQSMREQRIGLVQKISQYYYIYEMVKTVVIHHLA